MQARLALQTIGVGIIGELTDFQVMNVNECKSGAT